MDLAVTAFVAGVFGTLAMDLLTNLVARTGMLLRIDLAMIGRMAVGWAHGRFRYGHPGEMEQVAHETLYGYATHYTIGVGLCILLRDRLGSTGRRAGLAGMGSCLWCRDDGSFVLLRLPFHRIGSVWQAVPRRKQGFPFSPRQPPLLWSGSCCWGSTDVINHVSGRARPNKELLLARAGSVARATRLAPRSSGRAS
jgi:hypothetical protein